jgi:hypothetical protein
MARTRKTLSTCGTTPARPPWVLAEIDPTGQTYKVAKAVNYLDLTPGTVVDLNQLRCLQNCGVNVTVQLSTGVSKEEAP